MTSRKRENRFESHESPVRGEDGVPAEGRVNSDWMSNAFYGLCINLLGRA